MEKSLLLARRRVQEETSSDSSSPGKMDGIASVFGGKVAALPRRGSDKNLITGIKESLALQREETSHIPEDLAKRLAARRLAVDQAINEKIETPKQTSTFPRKTESAQLFEDKTKPIGKETLSYSDVRKGHQARRGNSVTVESNKKQFGPGPTISRPETVGEIWVGNSMHWTRPGTQESEKSRTTGTLARAHPHIQLYT